MQEHLKPWNPLTVEQTSQLLAHAPFPWWIAGGNAIELAVGKEIRAHGDIDILVLRRDHLALRAMLAQWNVWAADPPGTLRPWPVDERLSPSIHDVWCRLSPDDHWRLQIMIDESAANEWQSRRDSRIRASIESITWRTEEGIPYLAAHIQLYYKAKKPREIDLVDFAAVLENGTSMDHQWLRRAISSSYGSSHPWLRKLEGC